MDYRLQSYIFFPTLHHFAPQICINACIFLHKACFSFNPKALGKFSAKHFPSKIFAEKFRDKIKIIIFASLMSANSCRQAGKPVHIGFGSIQGKVLEWLKRHAWKACIRQKRIGGSNPPLSAKYLMFCS